MTRVGLGFDVHAFAADSVTRDLVLGGVVFDGERGLAGHSDADVVAHAIADALLGASGLGDLGDHFPDTDPAWQDADSLDLLRRVTALVHDAGWRVENVDCVVVASSPRIAPRRSEMQDRLEAVVGAGVAVKAGRPEGLGALGRGEGIACMAVALVERA